MFKEREERLGIKTLVFPLHYVDTDYVDGSDPHQCHDADVLTFLRSRQSTNFRPLRQRSVEAEDVSLLLETLATGILKALRDAGIELQRAEARRAQQEAEARRLAEEQRRAEQERVAQIAEEKRQTEETARLAEEAGAARLAKQQRQTDESARLAEDTRQRKEAEDERTTEASLQKTEAQATALAGKQRIWDESEVARSKDTKGRFTPAATSPQWL